MSQTPKKLKDHRVILVYVNQEGNLIEAKCKLTTRKRAVREASQLNRTGNKARVEYVPRQGLL